MIKTMNKIEIIGVKSIFMDTVEKLHELGVLHIEDVSKRQGGIDKFFKKMPLNKENTFFKKAIKRTIERLKNIMLVLKKPAFKKGRTNGLPPVDPLAKDFLDMVRDIESQAMSLAKQRTELKKELHLILRYERILKGLAPLLSKLKDLKFFETIGVIIEMDKKNIIPLVEEELEKITDGKCQIFVKAIDEETIGLVMTYPVRFDARIKSLLTDRSVNELKLPGEYGDMPVFEALKKMIVRRHELPRAILKIESTVTSLSERWFYKIEGWITALSDLYDEVETVNSCLQAGHTFIIVGWAPFDAFGILIRTLKKDFGEKLLVRELKVEEDDMDNVPVCISNPEFIKPFEAFMSILPLPKYGSIDPTPFVAVFFPAFFGLIIGDIGYGAVILLLCLVFKSRYKGNEVIERIFSILAISSLFAVFSGFLFGEFFGSLGEGFGLHPILFDRLKAVNAFLLLSVAIGIGHVFLGTALSFINYLERKKDKEAFGKVLGMVFLSLIFMIAAVLTGHLTKSLLTPGVVLLTLILPALVFIEGIMAPLEIFKMIGNILSYTRIMAIGLSSVALAMIANRFGSMTDNLFIGIVLLCTIHILNIGLGVFDSTVQSLRLHYVEFFGRFFEPGGRRYQPFKKHGL